MVIFGVNSMVMLINLTILFSAVMAIIALVNYDDNPKVQLSFFALMLCFFIFLIELTLIEQAKVDVKGTLLITWLCFSSPATLAIPALFYLYFRASLRLEKNFKVKDLLHFIIPIGFALLMIPYGVLSTAEKQAMWVAWSNNETVSWAFQIKPTREVRMGLVALLGALYIQLSWHELNYQHNRKAHDLLADFLRLRWVILVMAAGFSCILLFFIFRLSFKHTWLIASVVIPMVFFLGLLYWRLPKLGRRWWLNVKDHKERLKNQHSKSAITEAEQIIQSKDKENHKKYRSSVTVKIAEKTMEKIHQLMSAGLYKEANLSLGVFAKKLAISQHHLSQIINEQTQGNYFTLLNHYRITEAKKLLLQTTKSITEISYEVGYNSKSSFYSEFKAQNNCTPSEFKKANLTVNES
jgi:AraC-like DNA-binding protein